MAKRVWTRVHEACPRVSDSETDYPPRLGFLPCERPCLGAPSDDLPLVLQVLGVGGAGVAALGTV